MIKAALALANATANRDYVEQACAWTDVLDTHYWANDLGGYYLAADDTKDLIVRPFSGLDDATPNANAIMVSNLVVVVAVDRRDRATPNAPRKSCAASRARSPRMSWRMPACSWARSTDWRRSSSC